VEGGTIAAATAATKSPTLPGGDGDSGIVGSDYNNSLSELNPGEFEFISRVWHEV